MQPTEDLRWVEIGDEILVLAGGRQVTRLATSDLDGHDPATLADLLDPEGEPSATERSEP